jgi:parallel beta-helix repeat protein
MAAENGSSRISANGRPNPAPITGEFTMRPIRQSLALLALLAIFTALPARAETFHTCGTIIASLPAVISTGGVYCLTKDLNTAMAAGNAIDIQTNNVTIDCNGYKIGGLAAGPGSTTLGIHADNTRQNITVRNCGIRGFYEGILLLGGAGHLVEDNRLDNNLYIGISVGGDNDLVRRNRVYDTGGYAGNFNSFGIYGHADVIDNTVAGVFATGTDAGSEGIYAAGGTEIRGNQVRGLAVTGSGLAHGINIGAIGVTVRNNTVAATAAIAGIGIYGYTVSDTICMGNAISKFATPIQACQDGGGNASQ